MHTKIIAFALIFLVTTGLLAQNVKTSFESKKESSGQEVWYFSGTTDLPRFTVLVATLSYEKKAIFAGARIKVKRGNFQHVYRLPGRMPSGKYVWELSYRKELQIPRLQNELASQPDFSHQHPFMIGDAHQRRLEIQEIASFYKVMLGEIVELCQTARAQSDAFLGKPSAQDGEKVRAWLSQMQQKFQQLSGKISQSDSYFLGSYSHETLEEFLEIIGPLGSLWQAHSERLAKAYKLSMVDQQPLPDGHSDPAIYEAKIARMAQHVLASLPIAQNIQQVELEQDLRWFNQIYSDLNQQYGRMENQFDAAEWQKKFAFWQQDLQDFALKAAEYRKSSLAGEFTDLPGEMESLAKDGKNLLIAYTSALYKKNGTTPPAGIQQSGQSSSKLVAEMQQRVAKLYAIVTQKRQRESAERQQLWTQLRTTLNRLTELDKIAQESFQTKDSEAFKQREQKLRTQLDEVKKTIAAGKPLFPEICTDLEGLVYYLESLLHARPGTGHADAEAMPTSIVLRQHALDFHRLADQVDKKIQEAQK